MPGLVPGIHVFRAVTRGVDGRDKPGHDELRPSLYNRTMLPNVTYIESLGGFRLRVRFTDGSGGVHDFSAMVQEPGPMMEPLRDEAYFNRVFLEFGAPTWPNGFDIAPEWLRREMEAAGELTRVAAE